SEVTGQDLAFAETEVKKTEASEQLVDFLAKWGPWQEHIKRQYGQDIENESRTKSGLLEAQAEAGTIASDQYNDQYRALVQELQKKLQGLVKELTMKKLAQGSSAN